jgi:hypothetical protein
MVTNHHGREGREAVRRLRRFRARSAGREHQADPADATDASALADADHLVRTGRVREALDRLIDANRARRDPAIELRVIALRREAVPATDAAAGRSPWPPVYDDPFPDAVGRLPEVSVDDLSADVVGGAVAHHGALIGRRLFDDPGTTRVLDGMRRAQEQLDRGDLDDGDVERASWYRSFPASEGANTRARVQKRGGIWLADSPANTALVLDLLAARGVIDAVAGHLGERPCFSLQKSTLRRLQPAPGLGGWHQDGAFLGADVRTMNVWVALTPCGGDRPTPGLEVVPRRLDEILSTEGGVVAHSVDPDAVEHVTGETPTVRPVFEPGDGLLFDERFLHRTYLPAAMTDERCALECWFFAPSHRSPEYLPFLV